MNHDAAVTDNLKRLTHSKSYRRQRAFFIAKLSPILESSQILDVGCGEGSLSREIAEALGPEGKVVGLDVSADVLEAARQLTSQSKIEYKEGTATQLSFSDESFDIVLCCNSLKYLKGDESKQAMREMVRVLRHGGILLVADSDDQAITFNTKNQGLTSNIVSAYAGYGDPCCGRKLVGFCNSAGLEDIRVDAITLCETEFDESSAGYAMAKNICEKLVSDHRFSEADIGQWHEDLLESQREGSYFWSYTKYVCVGRKPSPMSGRKQDSATL
jgi:ubiquinone/menaquinone biosynthesis C-methylase UbiE